MPVSSCHCITQQLSTGSRSSNVHIAKVLAYLLNLQLRMLLDRDTYRYFATGIIKYLDKHQKKCINTSMYKDKLIHEHENKRIDKYKSEDVHPSTTLPQQQPSCHSHPILTLLSHHLSAAHLPPS